MFAIAANSSASVPGRIASHSSACSAVRLLRGSTTTSFPPRACIASSRPGKSGAVHKLPFDSYGFAPRINKYWVRSKSGTGTELTEPNIIPEETCFGIWSTVEALNRCREPMACNNTRLNVIDDKLCAPGLPKYVPIDSRPYFLITPLRPVSIACHASCHVAGTCTPLRLINGVNKRSSS